MEELINAYKSFLNAKLNLLHHPTNIIMKSIWEKALDKHTQLIDKYLINLSEEEKQCLNKEYRKMDNAFEILKKTANK